MSHNPGCKHGPPKTFISVSDRLSVLRGMQVECHILSSLLSRSPGAKGATKQRIRERCLKRCITGGHE